MRSRFIFIFLMVTIWLAGELCGQQPGIRFRHISYRDGLIQSPVATMLQDKSGYIWIGSWSGLSRYDGTTFRNFRPNDAIPTAISHNRINKLYEDHAGILWVGTGGGLNRYYKNTETFQHVGLSAAKGGGNFITAIEQDNFNKLWVATFKGIKFVSADSKSLKAVEAWKNRQPELYQGIVYALAEDKLETIWAGINTGLKRFNPQTGVVMPLPKVISENKALASAKIIVIKQDNNNNIWFGTENSGLFIYNPTQNTCANYVNDVKNPASLPSNLVNDILIKDNKVMIGTRNGLSIFNPDTKNFTNYNHNPADSRTLSDGSVWSLMEDHTGNVWIGTYSGGLNIYYPGNSNFTNIGEKVGNNIGLNKPLAEVITGDKDGGIWVGSFGGGLNYINRKNNTAKYFTVSDTRESEASDEVKSILIDSLNNLWAGTLEGLFKFNRSTGTFRHINLETTNNKTGTKLINALLAAKEGIWVGTNGAGLKLVSYEGVESVKLTAQAGTAGLDDNYINCLMSQDDVLWIGTQNGLNRYDRRTKAFQSYRRKNSGLGNNNVLSLFIDKRNHLWIGTDGGGLNYLDEKSGRMYPVRVADGLTDDVIASIIGDNSGALWVSTNNGISKLTFGNAAFPLARGNYHITKYNAANGLQSNQFLVNSAYRTPEGEIMFGGMNGITTFFPNRIIKNKFLPDILLTGFAINNKSVPFGKGEVLTLPVNESPKVKLAYDQNNLTIKFSALNFINPDKNVYAYKMAGLKNNEEWLSTGNQKEVSFTNLSPGRYTFTVKASNNDGYWNNKGRTLEIVITPPLWETWWAYLIYIFSAAFLFYKIVEFFQIRARLERDLYNEHLQNQRQEEFYKMKLDFFTNISHEIRTPLTLILGPVENLYNSTLENLTINRQVLQIKNNAERLLRLISELMDFRKADTGNMVLYVQPHPITSFVKEIYLSFLSQAESRHIQYDFIAESRDASLYIDHDQLEKVFFNLLSNAFKFTPDHGHITVTLTQSINGFEISIADNGKGVPPECQARLFTNFYQVRDGKANMGTGIGLALSKCIVELHGGNVSFKSTPQQSGQMGSTIFTVKLPLDFTPSNNVHLIGDGSGADNVASFRREAEIDILSIPEQIMSDIKSASIVLAEDNAEIRRFLTESLPGYQISAFEDGAQAYQYSIRHIPDLIISDVMMPVMDGLELCRKIKSDERTSHIPVILLTALATHIHQINGLQTGADVYLTKPFSTRLLELNINNLFSSRELLRKKFSQQLVLQPKQILLNNPDEHFIQKLMDIIEAQMENPEFGVVALGAEIGMSKSVLYKKICALTNLSPADFIKSMRLKRAADLLQQQKLSVNEVSVLVGFNDRKYFSQEFKKMYGQSPSAIISSAS